MSQLIIYKSEAGNAMLIIPAPNCGVSIEEIARIEFQFEGDAELNPGEGLNFHFALPLQTIAAPRPGQIDISVTIDDSPAGLVSFWMQDAPQ